MLTSFFSYARSDSELVLRLAKELRTAGASVWIDQLDILGGERWDQAVEAALRRCHRLVVALSPASVSSNSVMDEVSYALDEGKLLIPVLLADCQIPLRLRRLQYIDFRSDYAAGLATLRRVLAGTAAEGVEPPVAELPTVPTRSLSTGAAEARGTTAEQSVEGPTQDAPTPQRQQARQTRKKLWLGLGAAVAVVVVAVVVVGLIIDQQVGKSSRLSNNVIHPPNKKFEYIGCYEDRDIRDLHESDFKDDKMTTEKCLEFCKKKRFFICRYSI
jgi:hypothetical protein